MANINITSTTYSYIIFKGFALKAFESGVLNTDGFVLSEYKSLKNLYDRKSLTMSVADYNYVVGKISELSPSTGGGGGTVDGYTKEEVNTLLADKLSTTGTANSAIKLTPGGSIKIEGSVSSSSVSFDGTGEVILNVGGIDGTSITSGTIPSARIPTLNQNTTGNAATATLATNATKLATARTIGGVSFDGSANINLPGVNAAGTQNTSGNAATATTAAACTGNAATATKLATARTINGTAFDGSANITVSDNTKLALTGGTVTGNLNLNNPLSITSGGTSANSAAQARANLGIVEATTTSSGFISSSDKAKLDAMSIITIRKLTQAEYDVLTTTEKNAENVLFVIVE